MKRIIIMIMIVMTITLGIGISAYAQYELPDEIPPSQENYPYMVYFYDLMDASNPRYMVMYSTVPGTIVGMVEWGGLPMYHLKFGECYVEKYIYEINKGGPWERTANEPEYHPYSYGYYVYDFIGVNYSLGYAETTLEVEENQSSFFGIDFDYSGFFGDLRVQLGKKEESGTYKIIKEWQYPRGSGHVSIPANEIPQGNKGEYMITIYEGDTIINQYPYTLNVDKEPYCEINYPVNGMSYDYFPNVNIRYYDMGRLYIYINGEMYKQIQTKDKEGIEVVSGKFDLFDIGLNTVTVMNSSGQDVATVQYEVLREGADPTGELPEFEAESWVKELFNRIMNEYSLFFEYVKSMYAFLPVEIVGLVGIIMMLSVILWFTGRK